MRCTYDAWVVERGTDERVEQIYTGLTTFVGSHRVALTALGDKTFELAEKVLDCYDVIGCLLHDDGFVEKVRVPGELQKPERVPLGNFRDAINKMMKQDQVPPQLNVQMSQSRKGTSYRLSGPDSSEFTIDSNGDLFYVGAGP